MYWIYLIIFVLAVLIPEIVHNGYLFLGEEDLESLLVLCFGTVGIAVYFIKEKALVKLFKDRLRLQKQTNVISRDLSDSYSYIGEMNRRFDIVRDLVFHLPEKTSDAIVRHNVRPDGLYAPVLEAARLLSKADSVSICFADPKSGQIAKRIDDGEPGAVICFAGRDTVIETDKILQEENGCVTVRSPGEACGVAAFIVFPKMANRIEDADVFRMVASEALALYCIERRINDEYAKS